VTIGRAPPSISRIARTKHQSTLLVLDGSVLSYDATAIMRHLTVARGPIRECLRPAAVEQHASFRRQGCIHRSSVGGAVFPALRSIAIEQLRSVLGRRGFPIYTPPMTPHLSGLRHQCAFCHLHNYITGLVHLLILCVSHRSIFCVPEPTYTGSVSEAKAPNRVILPAAKSARYVGRMPPDREAVRVACRNKRSPAVIRKHAVGTLMNSAVVSRVRRGASPGASITQLTSAAMARFRGRGVADIGIQV